MAVPQSLEGLEILLSVGAGTSAMLKMDLVSGGKRVNPTLFVKVVFQLV